VTLFVYEISRELLNGFKQNLQGRRVWSLAGTSLKVKVNFGGLHAVYVWKNVFAVVLFSSTTELLNGGALLPLRQLSYASGLDVLVFIRAVNKGCLILFCCTCVVSGQSALMRLIDVCVCNTFYVRKLLCVNCAAFAD